MPSPSARRDALPLAHLGLARWTSLLLCAVRAGLYDRARYHLRPGCLKPLVSPLAGDDAVRSRDPVVCPQG